MDLHPLTPTKSDLTNTMWIQITNPATRSLYTDEIVDDEGELLMDEPVEFNENGTAQVSEALGEALVAQYEDIRPYEAGDSE